MCGLARLRDAQRHTHEYFLFRPTYPGNVGIFTARMYRVISHSEILSMDNLKNVPYRTMNWLLVV